MKPFLLALILALQVTQTPEPPERYPGSNEHREPPAGWHCEHQNYELSVPPERACSCERMCDDVTGQIKADKQCASWCWESGHCLCDMSNKQACHGVP